MNRVVISWHLRSNNAIKLSVTEAEYPEIIEICSEILFPRVNLSFMGVFVKYLIIMQVDNIGHWIDIPIG